MDDKVRDDLSLLTRTLCASIVGALWRAYRSWRKLGVMKITVRNKLEAGYCCTYSVFVRARDRKSS
jgi:hypothetical protein